MKIYVGNLPRTVTKESLKKTFEQHGTVNDVNVIIDRMTNQPRGFAFVDMPNEDEANLAMLQLNGASFEGRPLNVNEARPQEQRERSPRPSNGGQGGYGARSRSTGDRFNSTRGPRKKSMWNSR